MDRRRARTRAALIEAGQALFAARAPEAVSIDEIVLAADVAKGSFYNHFPDKEGLAREIAALVRDGVETFVSDITEGVEDPAERVARALCGFARQAAESPEPARAMANLFRAAAVPDLPMDRGVRADIAAGVAGGRFAGVELEAAVLMAVGIVQIAVARTLEAGDPSAAPDLAFGLLRGLGLSDKTARETADRAAAAVFA